MANIHISWNEWNQWLTAVKCHDMLDKRTKLFQWSYKADEFGQSWTHECAFSVVDTSWHSTVPNAESIKHTSPSIPLLNCTEETEATWHKRSSVSFRKLSHCHSHTHSKNHHPGRFHYICSDDIAEDLKAVQSVAAADQWHHLLHGERCHRSFFTAFVFSLYASLFPKQEIKIRLCKISGTNLTKIIITPISIIQLSTVCEPTATSQRRITNLKPLQATQVSKHANFSNWTKHGN